MQVILLERIPKLGQMGDTVRVRDGFARNYLLPQGKAMRATDDNMKRFESQRAQLETRNLEARKEAEAVGEKLGGKTFVVIRQAGERGQLYGSVSTRDIADAVTEDGFSISRAQVTLNAPIKSIGLVAVPILLHPEVEVEISINVARTMDEAERQARGEDVTAEEEEELDLAAEAFFEEEVPEEVDAGEGEEAEGEAGAAAGEEEEERQ